MTDYENARMTQARITRVENGFDTATITFADDKADLRATISGGASITVNVKDASDASWTTLFGGTVRFVTESLPNELLTAKCDGAGYGLSDMLCNQEYGLQSVHGAYSVGTLKEILINSWFGVIPEYTNKILNGSSSGFNYTYEIEPITGDINYLYVPMKPCQKVVEDLCDLVTAIKAGSAGPHWIVTSAGKILVSTIGSHSTEVVSEGWTDYVGGSQAASTLTQGVDFTQYKFETLEPEANHITYYGVLRKLNDYPTEGNSDLWSIYGTGAKADEDTVKVVGNYSLSWKDTAASSLIYYPSTDATWKIGTWGTKRIIPLLSFYARKTANIGGPGSEIRLFTGAIDSGSFFYISNFDSYIPNDNEWTALNFRVGPYWNDLKEEKINYRWQEYGSPSWNNISGIAFYTIFHPTDNYLYIDDLHFEGVICRIAKNSTSIAAHKAKMKVIKDDVGKDDSGNDDDSGSMAQLAYAELLRCQTTPTVGTVTVSMLKTAWPGMMVHIHARPNSAGAWQIDEDFRITQIDHIIEKGYFSTLTLTNDLRNHHARVSFMDLNKVLADWRPEFQDRQATSIKTGDLDINVTQLQTDYPSADYP